MSTPFSALKDQLRSGDLVLFSGKDNISSGIQWFSNSKWSHIGMVVRTAQKNECFLWESTTLSNVKDTHTGTYVEGVQLVSLPERIAAYEGEVAVRQLKLKRNFDMLAQLTKLRAEIKGRPYEQDHLQLIRSAYDGMYGDNTADLSSLFCSELVAEAYQRMGVLSKDLPSNEYAPRDFANEATLDLLQGTLGAEIYVIPNAAATRTKPLATRKI